MLEKSYIEMYIKPKYHEDVTDILLLDSDQRLEAFMNKFKIQAISQAVQDIIPHEKPVKEPLEYVETEVLDVTEYQIIHPASNCNIISGKITQDSELVLVLRHVFSIDIEDI